MNIKQYLLQLDARSESYEGEILVSIKVVNEIHTYVEELKRTLEISQERSKLRGDSLLSATKEIEQLKVMAAKIFDRLDGIYTGRYLGSKWIKDVLDEYNKQFMELKK